MSRLLYYLFRESLYTRQFIFALTGQVLILVMADRALLRKEL